MIIVTTDSIPGKNVQYVLGVVSAEQVIGSNMLRTVAGGISEILGVRSETHELMLAAARKRALGSLEEQSMEFGCNAVVGLRFNYQAMDAHGNLMLVAASGTAVRVEEGDHAASRSIDEEALYFMQNGTRKLGPFSKVQLRQMLRTGKLQPSDTLTKEDDVSGVFVSDILQG